jgi:hypothetical protein
VGNDSGSTLAAAILVDAQGRARTLGELLGGAPALLYIMRAFT